MSQHLRRSSPLACVVGFLGGVVVGGCRLRRPLTPTKKQPPYIASGVDQVSGRTLAHINESTRVAISTNTPFHPWNLSQYITVCEYGMCEIDAYIYIFLW